MRGWGFRRRHFQSKQLTPNLAYTLLAVRASPFLEVYKLN